MSAPYKKAKQKSTSLTLFSHELISLASSDYKKRLAAQTR
jgi:hypothetical protein